MTPDPLNPLRVIAVLAAWCGLLSLVIAKLLAPDAAVGAGVAVVLVAMSCSMYRSDGARRVRKALSYVVLAVATAYVVVQFTGSPDPTQLAQILPPLLIGVLLAQGLGADKRHDVMVSVTVGEFMIVLAAGVAPTPWLAAPLLAGWLLAIVALIQSHQLHAPDCSTPGLRPASSARRNAFGPAGAAAGLAMVLGLLLFLLIPQPSSSAAQRRLRGRLGESATGRGEESSGRLGDGPLDMRNRGDLGNRPVAEVPGDSPQLWRMRVYQFFDGATWTGDEQAPLFLGRQGRISIPADPLDNGVLPAGRQRTDGVKVREGFGDLLLSPGTPLVVATSGAVGVQGAAGVLLESVRGGYTVTSIEAETRTEILAAAQGVDPGDQWLQVPLDLPSRVEELAFQVAGGATSRPAAVQAISNYLKANKTYDLKSPVPPVGADAVDHFLFDSGTGFCEQFAAAEVVMLRILGIPARMATGYGYGKPQTNGLRLFTSANAHAWVEVWYPGIGWSPTDPTPPAVQGTARQPNVFQRFVTWAQKVLSTTRGRVTLALLIIVLAGVGFLVVWWRRRRTPAAAPLAPALLANSLLTAFARLEAALVADGRPRAPGETLSELQRRLGADAGGRRALETLELALYSPHLVAAEEARAATHAFEALASSTLAAHAARGQLADSIGVRR